MAQTWILPYPSELPQDYYRRVLASGSFTTSFVSTDTVSVSTFSTRSASFSGFNTGSRPPIAPNFGDIWSPTEDRVYVYTKPGVWLQEQRV